MVNISDAFIGTKQSRFAGMAIFVTIIIVCLSILFTNTDISLGQRFGIVFFIILTSIPSILLSLFELTCIVTGGNSKKYQWCHYFAWFVAGIIMLYSALIIISVIMSMFTYNGAMEKVKDNEKINKVSKDDANKIAETIIATDNDYSSDVQNTEIKEDIPKKSPQSTENIVPPPTKQSTPPQTDMKYQHSLSISPSPVGGMDMQYGTINSMSSPLDGFAKEDSLAEWKPMNNITVENFVKPMVNSSGSLGTTNDEGIPAPYANENFSSF